MTISQQDVVHLAQLSNVSLQDDELEGLTADLENIINYIKQLDELDTEGVEPTYQVTGLAHVSRRDVVVDGVSREQLLAAAPEVLDNQIKVPKVL